VCNSMAVVVIFSDVPLLCFLVVYKPKRKYAAFGVVLNSEIVVLSFPDKLTQRPQLLTTFWLFLILLVDIRETLFSTFVSRVSFATSCLSIFSLLLKKCHYTVLRRNTPMF